MVALADIIGQGVAASRPAAGTEGRLYYSTDTDVLERDNGVSWDALTPGGGTSADHDHTGTGDGGTLSNDKHDGYSEYLQIATPGTPTANSIRVYAKDKAGTATLYYIDEAGTEFELPTIVTGGGGAGSGAPADAKYITTQAEAGLSAEVLLSAVIGRGATGSKPAAGTAGRLYYDTTLSRLERDNGASWDVAEPTAASETLPATIIDAKGDLIVGTAADTAARLAVGSNGLVLTTDSGETTGLKWAAAGTGTITVREIDGSPSMTASVIEVTNAKLTDQGSGVARLDLAGSGGSSSTIHTDALASPPGSPANGDWWLPSDAAGFAYARISGAWVPFGPIHRLTEPVLGNFTWTNQSTATAVSTNGGIYLAKPAASGDDLSILRKTAPSTPYTVTVGFYANIYSANYPRVGVVIRDSSGGKIDVLSYGQSGPTVAADAYTSTSTFSGNVANAALPHLGPIVWLRIADNGTDHLFSWSSDGVHFVQIGSRGRTSWTANGGDQVGLVISSNNASLPAAAQFVHYKEA